jgi:glucose uptake protein
VLWYIFNGIVVSSFLFNTIQMKRPFVGSPFSDYFKEMERPFNWYLRRCDLVHWDVLSIIASGNRAGGFYGLGQGATVVALWEFMYGKNLKKHPPAQNACYIMLFLYLIGWR